MIYTTSLSRDGEHKIEKRQGEGVGVICLQKFKESTFNNKYEIQRPSSKVNSGNDRVSKFFIRHKKRLCKDKNELQNTKFGRLQIVFYTPYL